MPSLEHELAEPASQALIFRAASVGSSPLAVDAGVPVRPGADPQAAGRRPRSSPMDLRQIMQLFIDMRIDLLVVPTRARPVY
jgi:hypothetical protein